MSDRISVSNKINLESLRKEAKSLLKACRSRDAAALQRIRAGLSRFAGMSDHIAAIEIQLADVQHALARERGYTSWGELRRQNEQAVIPSDFSQPGSDGAALPEGFTPWRWSVSYTVRPEMHSPLVMGHEYKILVSASRAAPANEVFTGYAALYERASAIAKHRVAHLKPADPGMFLHTRVINQGWFRHKAVNLVRAFLTTGVVCLGEGETGPRGEPAPTIQALTAPGGMTPDDYVLPDTEEKRRVEDVVIEADVRGGPEEDIFMVSYGEYVPTCAELNYQPFVERAARFAKADPFLGGPPRVIRREWFCATHPDIAVVHIYLRV
jgi:hypothetical protein